ncbi:hypothetical protein SAMN04488561_3563 [Jiangella alba]|uniref:Uncharacterized protein n=2 Tax=Jiangella alba TaxID=561176 RepID=A0A1H5N0W3_9ACTN|nr:hypothetical protein SAMN04488561_3563 [Jiangella alba]
MSWSCLVPAVEEGVVSDPQITAALAYLNDQRLQRINDSIVLAPPTPLPTAAEVIAARTWSADNRPPMTPDEVRAAADIIERAAEPERPAGGPWRVRQLPARPIESGGRGGTGSSSGTGTTSGRGSQGSTGAWPTGTIEGELVLPDPKDILEQFLRWVLRIQPGPEPHVGMTPAAKLAAVNAVLRTQRPRLTQPQVQHLIELQAWFYYQARALKSQGIEP